MKQYYANRIRSPTLHTSSSLTSYCQAAVLQFGQIVFSSVHRFTHSPDSYSLAAGRPSHPTHHARGRILHFCKSNRQILHFLWRGTYMYISIQSQFYSTRVWHGSNLIMVSKFKLDQSNSRLHTAFKTRQSDSGMTAWSVSRSATF
jgi:hypothetical protein